MWSFLVHPNHYKKIVTFFFFLAKYKNEWKERKFRRQKNKKSDFYKNKQVTNIDDIDANEILVSKDEPYGTKSPFNTLLDTMIMMLLDYYV